MTHIVCEFVCRLLDRFIDNMKFNVEFVISRLTMRLQHRAAELAVNFEMGAVLFPVAPVDSSQQPELPQLRLGMQTKHVDYIYIKCSLLPG